MGNGSSAGTGAFHSKAVKPGYALYGIGKHAFWTLHGGATVTNLDAIAFID